MRTRLALALLALAALTACSSGGKVDTTSSVCTDFAKFIHDGRPAAQRADVVRSIGKVVDQADQRVQDAYPTLTRTATGPVSSQQLADDTFAKACLDAGWKG